MPAPEIIQVENLGKRFRIGQVRPQGTLRDSLTRHAQSWWRGLRGNASGPTPEDFWALRELNFSIRQGEVVGIIGRNGAGKSTLLKLLSRITEPTTGRITIEGRVASLLEVGTGFHGELSGRENIFLNGAILGMSRAEIRAKFDEIVAFAEVERFLDTPVKHYSSGMYVRLAFAVAAHLEPEILIVDEVLAVGDQEFQKRCLGTLRKVTAESGRTVLFVSHQLASIRQLCDRVLLLDRGQKIADGDVATVLNRYAEITTAARGDSTTYRHVRGDGRASIRRIAMSCGKEERSVFPIFEEITVALDYELRADLRQIEFFILIYDESGECLCASFQSDDGHVSHPSQPVGRVSLKFTNPLAPGRYLLSAGIFDSSREFLDWVEFAEAFQVESAFHSGRAFDSRLGRMSLTAKWSE